MLKRFFAKSEFAELLLLILPISILCLTADLSLAGKHGGGGGGSGMMQTTLTTFETADLATLWPITFS